MDGGFSSGGILRRIRVPTVHSGLNHRVGLAAECQVRWAANQGRWMELYELVEQVTDWESFLAFVESLRADRALADAEEAKGLSNWFDEGARGWQSGTIESFLEAGVAWARAADLCSAEDDASSLWRHFAHFLYMGKTYE